MTTGALGAALDQWGPIATVIAVLSGAAVAWYTAYVSKRFGVSGDEREARRDELAERRDTIADRDQYIESLMADRAALATRVDSLGHRVDELEQREDDTRTMLMMHAAWDWQAIELAREGGVTLPPPPPLMAPHLPRPREGD